MDVRSVGQTPSSCAATPTAAAAATQQQQQQALLTPLTPLQLRQWQRSAQRSVRLALTAYKAARTKVQAATEDGTAAATQLTNSLLTTLYLPDMPLPEVLWGVQGLTAAAVSKLGRRQEQQLQMLEAAVDQAVTAVESMQAAVNDVRVQLGATEQLQPQAAAPGLAAVASSSSGGLSAALQEAASLADPEAAAPSRPAAVGNMAAASQHQCSSVPVFHILTLPETISTLQKVLEMYEQDMLVKQQVLDSFAALMTEQGQQHEPKHIGSGASSSTRSTRPATHDSLRQQLTVLVTCWMTKPYVNDDEVEQLLQMLTDEMTGF